MYRKRADFALDQLRAYSVRLEDMLAADVARIATHEILSSLTSGSGAVLNDDDSAADEFAAVKETFPNILRGSLLPYLHSTFERYARSMASLFLPSPLSHRSNACRTAETINAHWAGTFTQAALDQLERYRRLRNACAHTGAEVGGFLDDPHLVKEAAEHTLGVRFNPIVPSGNEYSGRSLQLRSAGVIEFDHDFTKIAADFYDEQIKRVAERVCMPRDPR